MSKKIAVIVGSLRRESLNSKLASALAELGAGFASFDILSLGDVPMFNQDLEDDVPTPVLRLRENVRAADALLFLTPEYNRSIPAVMKNAVDWCSRPTGKGVLSGKPAATGGMSPGAVGTAVAQSQVKPVLLMLGVRLMGQPELYIHGGADYFDVGGKVADENNRRFLINFLKRFEAWIG
jgi:chromate reductase